MRLTTSYEQTYAKTLTMANTKYTGRVISYQIDLNKPITELYKKIIKFSNIEIPEEVLDNFVYKFTPPKSLNNQNISDMIGNIDGVINAMIKSYTGEYSNQDDETINILKDEMYKQLIRHYIPAIDWNMIDNIYKDAQIKASKIKQEIDTKKQIANNANNPDNTMGGNDSDSSSDTLNTNF